VSRFYERRSMSLWQREASDARYRCRDDAHAVETVLSRLGDTYERSKAHVVLRQREDGEGRRAPVPRRDDVFTPPRRSFVQSEAAAQRGCDLRLTMGASAAALPVSRFVAPPALRRRWAECVSTLGLHHCHARYNLMCLCACVPACPSAAALAGPVCVLAARRSPTRGPSSPWGLRRKLHVNDCPSRARASASARRASRPGETEAGHASARHLTDLPRCLHFCRRGCEFADWNRCACE
jgi:hypothetical protein